LITESKTALKFGALDAAVDSIDKAYAIHQTHESLMDMKKRVRALLQNSLEDAQDETSRALFSKQLEALNRHPAFAEDETN